MQGMRRQNQKEIAPEEWEEQQAVIWLLQGEEEKEEGSILSLEKTDKILNMETRITTNFMKEFGDALDCGR